MNYEHERLKMNCRVLTYMLRNFTFNVADKAIINSITSSTAFKDMEALSQDIPVEDVGELDTEVKPDKPEWEVNNER